MVEFTQAERLMGKSLFMHHTGERVIAWNKMEEWAKREWLSIARKILHGYDEGLQSFYNERQGYETYDFDSVEFHYGFYTPAGNPVDRER